MKLNRSAIAATIGALLASSGAQALTRAEYQALPANSLVFFGGATATDNTLEEAFLSLTSGICASNIDIYRGANQRVVTCAVAAGIPGVAAGTQIAFHKESEGGSSNGVNPLIAGAAHTLRWLNVGALPNDCAVAAVPATAQLRGYTNHTGCVPLDATTLWTAANGKLPTGGISDTEPGLSNGAPTAAAVNAAMTVFPTLDIIFGVPVNKKLYHALQLAQFGAGTSCGSDTDPTAADSRDLPTCVPSLTTPQVTGLYSQNLFDWNSITSANGTPLPLVAGVVAPTDTSVRICRRVASSGTQAGAEAFILKKRCVTGAPSFAAPDDGSLESDTINKPVDFVNGLVHANPSSGDVRNCLKTADDAGYWATGVLSTEVTQSNMTAVSDTLRFVGLDGYAPTLANVANGRYKYFTSNVVTRTKNLTGGAPGEVRYQIASVISPRLSSVAVLANLNATFANRPWGNGGIIARQGASALAPNTAPYSDAEMSANPVNTLSNGGNNCVPAYAIDPTPAF